MTIFVTNPRDHSVVLKSFDGDSVSVPSKVRRVPVASKFDWHVPSDVRFERGPDDEVCPTTIVPGRPILPPIPIRSDAAEAKAIRKRLGAARAAPRYRA